MAWMRQRDDEYHGVVQFSSFYGSEAIGDSEVSVHPIMNMEFCTPDDDDAESCNGRDSSDNIITFIDDYSSKINDDDDDDDDDDQEYENECSNYDEDNYYQGDSWRCQIKMGMSKDVHQEQNNKDSRVGISSGSDNDHHEHEDQMNEMEKNKLFWDTCLGIGEEQVFYS